LSGSQGTEYAAFIAAELKHEMDRRDSISTRAGVAVTSSTGLVTVTLAVFAVLKGKDFQVHGGGFAALLVALVSLTLSAALAVLAGLNWRYEVLTTDTLMLMLTTHWTDSEVAARNISARSNVRTLTTLRAGTNIKSNLLVAAGAAQVVAILALSVAALVVAAQ
jgi:hypothetical protein